MQSMLLSKMNKKVTRVRNVKNVKSFMHQYYRSERGYELRLARDRTQRETALVRLILSRRCILLIGKAVLRPARATADALDRENVVSRLLRRNKVPRLISSGQRLHADVLIRRPGFTGLSSTDEERPTAHDKELLRNRSTKIEWTRFDQTTCAVRTSSSEKTDSAGVRQERRKGNGRS